MPNTAPDAHATPRNQHVGDVDKENNTADYSSGTDSDNDIGITDSGTSRTLKRKRPLTVSWVPCQAMSPRN